jgi:2-polyprenyl-3-methyl-5-hydroxy-6-metoxy-1,4-benzoquinol methylase
MDRVRERFERDAEGFDAIYRLERSPFWRRFNTTFRKAIFERFQIAFEQAGDVSGKAVLDIGCGSGVYSVEFARRGARKVVGLDFSSAMLEIARQESLRQGTQGRCEFVRVNFLEWQPAEAFDVAIAMGVFDYLPDPLTFLRRMASATSTSGRVIASFPGHSLLRKPLRRLRYKLAGKGDVYYYTLDDVKRLAEESGLERHTIIPIRSSGTGFILVGSR